MNRRVLMIVLGMVLLGGAAFLFVAHLLKPSPPEFSETGGFELVYALPRQGHKTRALMDDVIAALKERFDPDGARGIEWAIDENHLTVRVPVPSAHKAKREQWTNDAAAMAEIGISPIDVYELLHRDEPLQFGGRSLERDEIIDQIVSENTEHEGVIRRFADHAIRHDLMLVDNPDDMVAMIGGMVPLEFRIAPSPESVQDVQDYVALLTEGSSEDGRSYRWFPIMDVETFAPTEEMRARFEWNPQAFFADMGMIACLHDGRGYLLLGNTINDTVLPIRDGFRFERVAETQDRFGRPAVGITLNEVGGKHMKRVTSANIGRPMAVLVGGEVYSAPNINAAVERELIIEGRFSVGEFHHMLTIFKHSLPISLQLLASKLVSAPGSNDERIERNEEVQ